jgi:hypothetical protein
VQVAERHNWILKYIASRPLLCGVDILDSEFVDSYAEKTDANLNYMHFGANKCRRLGSDLSAMHKKGLLDRCSVGLSYAQAGIGFPKWVWSYSITSGMVPHAKMLVELDAAEILDATSKT